jgi:hypothetical protein
MLGKRFRFIYKEEVDDFEVGLEKNLSMLIMNKVNRGTPGIYKGHASPTFPQEPWGFSMI